MDNYWEKRFLKDKAAAVNASERYLLREQKKYFTAAAREITEQIEKMYQSFADGEDITLAEAKRRISRADFKKVDFEQLTAYQIERNRDLRQKKDSLPEDVAAVMEKQHQAYESQLRTLTRSGQLTHLNLLQANINKALIDLYDQNQISMYNLLAEEYESSYYRGIFNSQQAIGFGKDFAALNQRAIQRAVLNSYGKANYSKRLYVHCQHFSKDFKENLIVGLIRGESMDAMAGRLKRRMGVAYSDAKRLVRTETAYIYEQATAEAYQECGIEQYEFMATLDNRTSPVCQELDGRVFHVKDAVPGKNYPPMHPNCRSTTVCHFDNDKVTQRIAKDKSGKYYEVPSDMTYKEWSKSFVEGDKTGLQEAISEKEMTIEEIKKQMAENNTRIETLASEYSQKHQALENALLFGTEDVDTLNRMSQEVQAIKTDLDDMIAKTDTLKAKLPQESVQAGQSAVVEGKNLIGDIDYTSPELANFDHVIEKSIHAQGFDGNPNVVEYEDFKKAMEESGFYAERTYSADTQVRLDTWQNDLYNGKWYIDCSEGGAQYGQGMYCASCYDITDNQSMGGIGFEMSHYQEIGVSKGNAFSYTEAITIQPNAKIFELPNHVKTEEYISDAYRNAYLRKFATKEQMPQVEKYIDYSTQITNLSLDKDMDFIDNLYQNRAKATIGIEQLLKDSFTAMEDVTDGKTYHGFKNPGVLVAEMGYDAIKAVGHGESGSYTVILNRTKVIFCKGGSIYGN